MIKRILNFEKTFSIAKAASIVGFFTLLTKIIAIYRERLFSSTFGQGPVLDSYFSAFRIPDFITNLFVLSTLSVAFLPIYTNISQKNEEEGNKLVNTILVFGSISIGLLCLLLFVFSSPLTHFLVPGFSTEQFLQTLHLTRLFLISPIIFTISTVLSGVLNAKKKFIITSFAPILYNGGIILGVVYFYPRFGIMGLGYGVITGAIFQLLIQILATAREGFSFFSKIDIHNPAVIKIFKLYIPRIFAFDLSNITLLLGTMLGSIAVSGSITALNQAYNLQSVPVGIFGYSIAVAAFPALSEHYSNENHVSFQNTLYSALTKTLLFIIPISILTLIYRAYVVRIILGSGAFTWEDTIRTFGLLGIFSFSFFSQCLTTLLSRAFFARQNTRTPVIVNIISIGINVVCGIILGKLYGVTGLTIAFVIASVCNGLTLFILLRKNMREHSGLKEESENFDKKLYTYSLKCLFASALCGVVSYGGIKIFAPYVNTQTTFGILIQCGLSLSLGFLIYGILIIKMNLITGVKQLWIFSRK